MPTLGLVLSTIYVMLAFGLRMFVQLSRTGSTGLTSPRAIKGTAERVSGLLLVTAVLLCLAGQALQLAGAIAPAQALVGWVADVVGVGLVCAGIAITLVAQFGMGDAWRIGVDPSERTELVVDGLFAMVRNPIYAAMIPAFVGIALLCANAVTIAGAVLVIVALELQTRLVEEPYLAAVHGMPYSTYASRVGRFLPGIGRLRSNL